PERPLPQRHPPPVAAGTFRVAESPPAPAPRPGPIRPAKKPAAAPDIATLPPLTTHDPPVWLRHLHWLLVLFLIPLAFSLLQKGDDEDVLRRLIETIDEAPPDAQARAEQALADAVEGKGSLDRVFEALPEHKIKGAFLP